METKPVAWMWTDNEGIGGSPLTHYADVPPGRITNAIPLYAAPVQQAPSTNELLRVARLIEDLKQDCGMDPESPVAIRNGRYMSIAAILRGMAAAPVQQAPSITVEPRMGETAQEYQVRLEIGVQSFTICQPRETMAEAEWLAGQLRKAFASLAPVQPATPAQAIQALNAALLLAPDMPVRGVGLAAQPAAPQQPESVHSVAGASSEDATARDAARYRWLCSMSWGVPRDGGWHDLTFRDFGIARWSGTTKEVADAAIDAAMQASDSAAGALKR